MKSLDRFNSDAAVLEIPPRSRLGDLPILFAALYHGFRLLIERLRMGEGLSSRVRLGMGSIFFALCEEDDCIIKSLAERLCLPKATLTDLLDTMEKNGVIERHPCPEDGRAYRIRLTAKAKAMKVSMVRRHDRAVEILQAGLQEAEAAELRRMLSHVLENLRKDEESSRKARKVTQYEERVARLEQKRRRMK